MAEEIASEILWIQNSVADIRQQLMSMSKLLLIAGRGESGLSSGGTIRTGNCMEEIARKICDGEGGGILDRLYKVESALKRSES